MPTSRLNQFLKELVAAHPHPLRGGKQPKILFGTQAAGALFMIVYRALEAHRLDRARRAEPPPAA